MNVWASKKDISIKYLLLILNDQFQPGSYDIVQNPMDDDKAIRLANPGVTNAQLYVFTYGQDEGCYGVHIEFPDLQETNYSDTLEIHENISFSTLVNIVQTTLEIPAENLNPNQLF